MAIKRDCEAEAETYTLEQWLKLRGASYHPVIVEKIDTIIIAKLDQVLAGLAVKVPSDLPSPYLEAKRQLK